MFKALTENTNRWSTPLLFLTFLNCFLFYLLSSILPIYLTESPAQGGLGWSKDQAFSLFGTYFALSYIAPLLGGIVSDLVLGNWWTTIVGFSLTLTGLGLCFFGINPQMLPLTLLLFAIGNGFIKVCLTSAVDSQRTEKPKSDTHNGYQVFYLATCLGFIVGHFTSHPLYLYFGFQGIVNLGYCLLFLMALVHLTKNNSGRDCHALFKGNAPINTTRSQSEPEGNLFHFFLVLGLGFLFFSLSTQLNTSMCVYVNNCVPREIVGRTVPALWISGIASLTMMFLVPILSNKWKKIESGLVLSGVLKQSFGFLLLGCSFGITATYARYFIHSLSVPLALSIIYIAHLGIFIADSHVRPTLWSAASRNVPYSYRSMAVALTYLCIGLGAKQGGILAGMVERKSFGYFFAFASISSIILSIVSYLIWQHISRKKRLLCEHPAS